VTGVSPVAASDQSGTEMAAGEAGVSDEGTGELSLLLPAEGGSESAGTGEAGEVDELRTKLALAEEELDASRIENLELESRIAELQARLSKVEELQKMVEIEDDSLAQMQAQQAQAEPTEDVEEIIQQPDASEAVTEAIQADEEALLEELLAEEAAAQAEEQAIITEASGDEMVSDEQVTEEAVSDDVVMKDDGMADEMVAGETMTESAETDEVAPPPAPVIVTEPVAREPSVFDGILPPDIIEMIPSMPAMGGLFSDPIILAAIGGVVILLIILLWFKRRQASAEDESGITVSGDDDLFAEDEEELTPIHLADAGEPEETDIKIPTQDDIAKPQQVAEPVDDLAATSIISATDMPEPEAPAPAAAASEQDDVLNEVDVYLAYGLYDNAEELLNNSLVEHPQRADYRSKLLDTYFATKKVDAFVGEAEKLKSMGDAGSRYWDRVQVMGYELVPDNPLFSAAKDIGISAADLEITKPQEADFDLGSSEDDDTNFSTTDFNLGEEDTGGDFSDTSNLGEAGSIAATQQIPQLDGLPDFGDEDDTDLRGKADNREDTRLDLPEEIGEELEFSMDEPASGDADLELPDDLDLGNEEQPAADTDLDDLAMEFDVSADEADAAEDISEIDFGAEFEAALEAGDELDIDDSELISFEADVDDVDEDAVEIGVSAEEAPEQTAIITPNYEETEVVPKMDAGDSEDESEIDLGMEDTAMLDSDDTSLATGELNLDTRELKLPTDDDDDDEDISIIDFGGEDFIEPTDIIESIDDDSLAMDGDDDGDDVKTGTFAPGDFEEPTAKTASVGDIDDIGDLMLPDDVDEVSTKLDLARAFIDMGDTEGARGSLEEVLSEGNAEQKAEAKALLDQI
ncbi:MAG: hypothetical protein OER87_12690, partial [Gammaproteobacteria bacterium]|nr:hypothetical protein [Gammaproteobacteria bacterium]